KDMTAISSKILIGTVTNTESKWIDRRLVTVATVAASDVLKGDTAPQVTVVLPGGVDAKRRFPVAMTYAGAPTMFPTEEVALFLNDKSPVAGSYSVTGFAQGKFSIANGADGKMVTRDMTMAPLKKGVGMARGNHQVLSLEAFKAEVN